MKATAHETDFAAATTLQRTSTHFITKKVWLPKAVYEGLPYFYLISGIAALIATIYIGAWYWVVPHYVIFAAVCIQVGISVFRKRRPPEISIRPPRNSS